MRWWMSGSGIWLLRIIEWNVDWYWYSIHCCSRSTYTISMLLFLFYQGQSNQVSRWFFGNTIVSKWCEYVCVCVCVWKSFLSNLFGNVAGSMTQHDNLKLLLERVRVRIRVRVRVTISLMLSRLIMSRDTHNLVPYVPINRHRHSLGILYPENVPTVCPNAINWWRLSIKN